MSTEQNDPDNSNEQEIQALKQKLLLSLHSYESVIFYFEQLLVWDRPAHSAVFVFILHLIFWYIKLCSTHIAGTLAGLLLIVLWLDMWKDKIWPEIRAVAPDPEENEWGELHPRLPGLPELCQRLAEIVVSSNKTVSDGLAMRRNYPAKFCAIVVLSCSLLIFIGNRVPGLLLAYVLMLCCLLFPVILYRRILERAYKSIEPFFMQLQYSLKPKMKRQKKHFKRAASSPKGASIEVITDSSEDDELSNFVSPLDAKTADLIARALTDESELSDSDESLLAHECPSLSSHGSSLDGDKEARNLAEVQVPEAIPKFDDPDFTECAEGENLRDGISLPHVPPNTLNPTPGLQPNLGHTIVTAVVQETVSNVLQNTAASLADWSKKQQTETEFNEAESKSSTPSSDDGFIILDKEQ